MSENIGSEARIPQEDIPPAIAAMFLSAPPEGSYLVLGIDRAYPYQAWVRLDDARGTQGEKIPADFVDAEKKSVFTAKLPVAVFYAGLTNNHQRKAVEKVADKCAPIGGQLVNLKPLVVVDSDADGQRIATATKAAKEALKECRSRAQEPTLRALLKLYGNGLDDAEREALAKHGLVAEKVPTKMSDKIVAEAIVSEADIHPAIKAMLLPAPSSGSFITLGIDRAHPYQAWVSLNDAEGLPSKKIPVDLADEVTWDSNSEMHTRLLSSMLEHPGTERAPRTKFELLDDDTYKAEPNSYIHSRSEMFPSISITRSKNVTAFDAIGELFPDADKRKAFTALIPVATFYAGRSSDHQRGMLNSLARDCVPKGQQFVNLKPLVEFGFDADGQKIATVTKATKIFLKTNANKSEFKVPLMTLIKLEWNGLEVAEREALVKAYQEIVLADNLLAKPVGPVASSELRSSEALVPDSPEFTGIAHGSSSLLQTSAGAILGSQHEDEMSILTPSASTAPLKRTRWHPRAKISDDALEKIHPSIRELFREWFDEPSINQNRGRALKFFMCAQKTTPGKSPFEYEERDFLNVRLENSSDRRPRVAAAPFLKFALDTLDNRGFRDEINKQTDGVKTREQVLEDKRTEEPPNSETVSRRRHASEMTIGETDARVTGPHIASSGVRRARGSSNVSPKPTSKAKRPRLGRSRAATPECAEPHTKVSEPAQDQPRSMDDTEMFSGSTLLQGEPPQGSVWEELGKADNWGTVTSYPDESQEEHTESEPRIGGVRSGLPQQMPDLSMDGSEKLDVSSEAQNDHDVVMSGISTAQSQEEERESFPSRISLNIQGIQPAPNQVGSNIFLPAMHRQSELQTPPPITGADAGLIFCPDDLTFRSPTPENLADPSALFADELRPVPQLEGGAQLPSPAAGKGVRRSPNRPFTPEIEGVTAGSKFPGVGRDVRR